MLPPLDYTTFIEWFPEFSGLPSPPVKFRLELSNDFLDPCVWSKFYQRASALLTAHYLSLRYDISDGLQENGIKAPSSSVGFVNQKTANTNGLSEGSVTNAMVTGDDPFLADLSRTGYGLEFLSLLELWIPAGMVVYSKDTSSALRVKQ